MRKGYNYIYKYLILYIVLSFIDNKHIINCQKLTKKLKLLEMSNEVTFGNGTMSLEEVGTHVSRHTSNFSKYSALVHKSDQEEGDTDTEHGVTCYTCVNVSDNHICNKYAIDRPCKQGNNFCHTLHIMDPKGRSVIVNKKCANETECTPHSIGCYHIDNQKICISCCDEDYCNKRVPTQTSNAIFKNAKTVRQKQLDSFKDRASKHQTRFPSNRACMPRHFLPHTFSLIFLCLCILKSK